VSPIHRGECVYNKIDGVGGGGGWNWNVGAGGGGAEGNEGAPPPGRLFINQLLSHHKAN
jgi:hypothetical protein